MTEKNMGSIKVPPFRIAPEGSLGLLALGAKGLQAWRKSRMGIPQNDPRIIGPIVLGKELNIIAKQPDEEK